MTTDPFIEAANAAAREYARTPRMNVGTVSDRIGEAHADGWEAARTHLAAQEPTTLPERFRDPDSLARFVIENEWALDSGISPSGIAEWRETLDRVYEAWDGDTPGDILSTIAAAIRLDRHFRAPAQEPTDAELDALHDAFVAHSEEEMSEEYTRTEDGEPYHERICSECGEAVWISGEHYWAATRANGARKRHHVARAALSAARNAGRAEG